MTFQRVITQAFVDQFLRLIAFLESQSGLFSIEKGVFSIWTTLYFDRCHMAFWLGFSSGLETGYFSVKHMNFLLYDWNMDDSNAKMVTILKIAQEMQELWPFEKSYFSVTKIIRTHSNRKAKFGCTSIPQVHD